MRHFALLALVPTLILAAPSSAFACGDEGGGEAGFVFEDPPVDSRTLLLTRARQLDVQAADARQESREASRRARTLLTRARQLQRQAFQREGMELTSLLMRARQMALQANEAKAHSRRASQRARSFAAQARELRLRANGFASDSNWRNRRRRVFVETTL